MLGTAILAKSMVIGDLSESGQISKVEPLTASFPIPKDGNITADVTIMGIGFKWCSSITPTKEQFLSGKYTWSRDGQSISSDFRNFSVTAEATGAYLVQSGDDYFIVSTVTENEIGTLPKTGLYYSTTVANEGNLGGQVTLDFGATIHPIDPKYLPGVCLPVVEITSAEYPTDSTLVTLSETENMAFDKAALEGIPCVVKLTFNGMSYAICCWYLNGSYAGFVGDQQFAFFIDNSRWTMGG